MPGKRKGILIIDKQSMSRKTIYRMLEYYEFPVFEAADARAGLEALNQERGQIGLVLLDTTLPGITPDKMITLLRSVGGDVPIGICTDESVSDAKADYDGVTGVLRKPIRTDRLLAVVRKAMGIE